MAITLGIDPGSRVTGFGVIEIREGRVQYLASGCIRTTLSASTGDRLQEIYDGLGELIRLHQPAEVAIEKIFMARSAESALKLGQARGVALLAAASAHVPISEYEAKKIKQAVVGNGAATKSQVQHMVEVLLSLQGKPQQDAADALAIALCHVQTSGQLLRIGAPKAEFRRGRLVESNP